MTVGLPRSGKSTWVLKNKGHAAVVCPDEIRLQIFGHQFHKPAEDFIWGIARSMTRMLLAQKFSVILDATSVSCDSRRPWLDMASGLGAGTRIVFVNTPWKVCIARNRRSGEKKVPEDTIRHMASRLDRPNDSEADEIVIVGEKPAKKAAKSGRRTK